RDLGKVLILNKDRKPVQDPGRMLLDAFVPGRDSDGRSSPGFDRNARYLYLYQTINDMPQAADAVRSTSVLLFDPALLTSWGHFRNLGFFAAEGAAADRPGAAGVRAAGGVAA